MQDGGMKPITIYLEPAEKLALAHLARRERRDYRDQAALLIRMQLIASGVLQDEPPDCIPTGAQGAQIEVRHGQPASV